MFCPVNFGKYIQRVVLVEQAWRLESGSESVELQ